ncbi:piggyBac transposable element-derived protein 3-like [Aphis gossypii]|uniref:piggyBac transposable element-derived protein 3-like n=1 Tax=Aphis gossypii TaxID=80765 RepID=UPI002158E3F8|nr:piggyBac transposable element-derived protein 3-like [Aphis gossypii]
MSKNLTDRELVELIDADMSDFSGLEDSDVDENVEEIDKSLAEFDEEEDFVLSDSEDIEENGNVDSISNSKYFTLQKNQIKWQQKPFTPPTINLNDLNEAEPPTYLYDPIYYFSKYFDDKEFDKMAYFTNLYATQQNSTRFKPTTSSEIRDFIAIHMVMGALKMPRVRMYWEKDTYINLVAETMPRNRFFSLRTHFHVVDNMEIPKNNNDKFFKIRPLFEIIKKRCSEIPVERNLSVDEQMIPFKGHLSIKQYIRGKPNPWGIKTYLLCGQSGLVYNLILYQGNMIEVDDDLKKTFGVGGAVVISLTENLKPNCHYLTMDNFFTSFNLFYTLQKKQIYATGTIRTNRFNNPPFLSDKEMKKMGRGTTFEISSDIPDVNLGLVKWYDNKPINLCSNVVASGKVDTIKRWDRINKKYVYIDQPEIVGHYNNTMGGVDKHDQLVSLYRCFIKSKKWTLRMVSHAFEMAVSNSWLEYVNDAKQLKIKKKDTLDLLGFRMRLAKELILLGKTVITPSRKVGRPSSRISPNLQEKLFSPLEKKKK